MTKKDEFSDLAKDLDRKFKEIEEKKMKIAEGIKKVETHRRAKNPEIKVDKIKEQIQQEKIRMKEKILPAFMVLIIGQILLIPICISYSDNFLGIWLMGTFSICIICLAIIDLAP